MINRDDVEDGIRELERAARLGLSGAMITEYPLEERRYDQSGYEPFWDAAAALGMPLSLHTATRRQGRARGAGDKTLRDASSRATKAFNPALSLCDMIFSGVFERHPRLRWPSSSSSWPQTLVMGGAPSTLDVDYTCRERRGEADLPFRRRAAERLFQLFPPQPRLDFQEDAIGIRLCNVIGVDNMMWGSDTSEDDFQQLLAKFPSLLSWDQSDGSPRRWLLLKREKAIPAEEEGSGRFCSGSDSVRTNADCRVLNQRMDPAEMLALEPRQFAGEGLKMIVPMVYGQTEEALQKKSAMAVKRQWDEEAVLADLERRNGPEALRAANKIVQQMKKVLIRSRSGRVAKTVPWEPRLWPMAIAITRSQFGPVGEFQYLIKGPFESEEKRRELLSMLNEIRAVNLAEDSITKRPPIGLKALLGGQS